jgi:uncharacterized protein YrrD
LQSGSQFLRRSVLLRGVKLGEVEDLLLDGQGRRVLGFAVLCGDGVRRMLPLAAVEASPANGHVDVSSALVLMEDGFYRERTRTLTGLLDCGVRRDGLTVGTLTDVQFDDSGRIRLLEVDGLGEVSAGGLAFEPVAGAAAD